MGESIHGRRTVPLRMNVFGVSTLSAGLRALSTALSGLIAALRMCETRPRENHLDVAEQ